MTNHDSRGVVYQGQVCWTWDCNYEICLCQQLSLNMFVPTTVIELECYMYLLQAVLSHPLRSIRLEHRK